MKERKVKGKRRKKKSKKEMYTVCIKNINCYWNSPEKFVFHKDNEFMRLNNNLDWIYDSKIKTIRYFHETCQSNKILQCTHEKCKKTT